MTKQFVLPPAGSRVDRRQPLLESADNTSRGSVRKRRLAEVAGGTAAECAAVCCCPCCSLVNLLVLALYKLPAWIFRKALRRRLMKAGEMLPRNCSYDEKEFGISDGVDSPISLVNGKLEVIEENKEVVELDKEMFEKFRGGGFWRSPSKRNEQ